MKWMRRAILPFAVIALLLAVGVLVAVGGSFAQGTQPGIRMAGPVILGYLPGSSTPFLDVTQPGMTNLPTWITENPVVQETNDEHLIPKDAVQLPDWIADNPAFDATSSDNRIPGAAIDPSGISGGGSNSGLTSVATNATLDGDGTAGSPLAVVNPYLGAPTPQPTPTPQPVPALSDATPRQDGGAGNPGNSGDTSRADHQHPEDGTTGDGSGLTPQQIKQLNPYPGTTTAANEGGIPVWNNAADAYQLGGFGSDHGYTWTFNAATDRWQIGGGPRVVDSLPALTAGAYDDGDVIYLSSPASPEQEGWYEVVDGTDARSTLSLTGWTPARERNGDEYGFNQSGDAGANRYGTRPSGMPSAVTGLFAETSSPYAVWLETTNSGTFNTAAGVRLVSGSYQWLLSQEECYAGEGGDPGYCGYVSSGTGRTPWTTAAITASDNVQLIALGGARPFTSGGLEWSRITDDSHAPAPWAIAGSTATIPSAKLPAGAVGTFTGLTDTPSSIDANAVVAGASTGNTLAFKSLDALLSGHQAGVFDAITGNGWTTATCSATSICIAEGAQSWDTGSATSGATTWKGSYTFASAPANRELLVRVPVSWTDSAGRITRAVRIAPFHIYNDDLTLLLGNSGGFDYFTATPARILPDTTVAVQTFDVLAVDGSKLRIDYDQITGSPAAKPPGRNSLPTTGLYVGYRVVLLNPDVWELGREYTATNCAAAGCVQVNILDNDDNPTGYTVASYSGSFTGLNSALLRGKTFVIEGEGTPRSDGKTPAKLHSGTSTYSVTMLSDAVNHFYEATGGAPQLVNGTKYRLNIEFTDGQELVPFTTYQPGDYEWDGNVWVPTPGSVEVWAECCNTIRIPVNKLPRTGTVQVHNGPGVGRFINSANGDYTSGFQAFSPAFDLDDDDKQSGIMEVEATLHLSQKSQANLGFSSGGADQTIVLRGFVFASTLRTSAVYSGGTRGGVLIDDGEVYAGTTDAGDVEFYLARNGTTNQAGYYLYYDGATGTQSFAIGVDLQVAFVHNDANAPATQLPHEYLVREWPPSGNGTQITGLDFTEMPSGSAFTRTLTSDDRNRTINIQVTVSNAAATKGAKVWSTTGTMTVGEWMDSTPVSNTDGIDASGAAIAYMVVAESQTAYLTDAASTRVAAAKGSHGRVALVGTGDTAGPGTYKYVQRLRVWLD